MESEIRILIAEDDEGLRSVMSQVLEEGGYQVAEAETGEEALAAFRRAPFPVVFTDIVMGGMNGLELLREIKQIDSDTQVIVVTSYASMNSAIQAMRYGANDYLAKPFEDPDLILAVANRCREKILLIRQNRALLDQLREKNQELEKANDHLHEEIRRRKRDQSALKIAMTAAQEGLEQIDNIIKSVADGLIVTDTQNRILLMNQAAERLLGVQWLEVVRQPIVWAFRNRNLQDQFKELLLQPPGEAKQADFELSQPGSAYPQVIQARASLMKNRAGQAIGTVTILRDVSRERQLEQMKNDFISTAAHELRTPLTALMGYAELLLRPEVIGGVDPGLQKEFLTEVYEKTEALAHITDNLLDISRVESGQGIPLEKSLCDLDQVLARVVRIYHLNSPGHQLQLILAQDGPHQAWVDRDKIVQVLENLISNAIKYSPRGGPVRVKGEFADGNYVISVEDDGIGMSQDQVQRVFDKFYRADASDTAIGGLGLGMSIVKQIIECHGGEIRVESEPQKGTLVVATFPVSGSPNLPDLQGKRANNSE